MAQQMGYLTDLSAIQLEETAEGNYVSTFQAMPHGDYSHPIYGDVKFDSKVTTEAALNVNNKVRGQDLDIDYDHKQYGGEAAGWVKMAQARTNGLWLTVEWTKKAADLIKSKAYRYFSPEFADEWEHPKTKDVHKNVLFGGAITNRPFLKDILPLNMSELSFAEQQEHREESGMDPKKLRQLLGLPEDATDEQVESAVAAYEPPAENDPPAGGEVDQQLPGDGAEDNHQVIAASEGQIEGVIKRLSESSNAEVKALAELVGGLHQHNSQLSAALQLSETARTVQRLSEPTNGRALPAGAQKKLQEVLLAPTAKGIADLVESLNKTGYVKLGETKVQEQEREASAGDAIKKFTEAVDEIMKNDAEIEYSDAVEQAATANPTLFAEYRDASYAFREN